MNGLSGENAPSCVVAVVTYKRPEQLRVCISSVVDQVRGAGAVLLVVDNDPDGSAKKVAAEFTDAVYALEKKAGIAHARNRAVAESVAKGAQYIAFIDDDETASPTWLPDLLAFVSKAGADAVGGPTLAKYPRDADGVIVRDGFFNSPTHLHGERVTRCSTANVLIRLDRLLALRDEPFDPAFGLSGGSDSELFQALTDAGYVLRWCASAAVTDHIPLARISRGWISQRLTRYGNTDGRILLKSERRLRVAARGALRVVVGLVPHLVGGIGRTKGSWRNSARYLRGRGMLDAARGHVQQEYSRAPR